MKNVVMVAYGFPPEGRAGAYRPLRFVRELPNQGWSPIVISVNPSQYERYDPALLEKVPKDVEVVRIKACDWWQDFQAWRSRTVQKELCSDQKTPIEIIQKGQKGKFRAWLKEIVRTIEAWSYHPDMAAPWINSAVKASTEVCNRNRVSVIWATAGPVSAFHVAQRTSQRTGIPYVLDFRDSWTIAYNEFEARRPKWAIRLERKRMFKLLEGAQSVVFRYASEAECYWRAYHGALDPMRVHIISNGYEGSIEDHVIPTGDRCQIVYTGTLRSYRYDTLLESLKILKATEPVKAKQLHLLFVGETPGELGEQLKELDLTDIVEVRAPTSHSEVISLHRESHGFLILGRSSEFRGHELLVGAKLFEYLKGGRPVIGVLPSDETKNILQHLNVKTVADVNSPSEIVTLLLQVLDAWSTNALSVFVPEKKLCERYSAEKQSAALTRALEGKPPLAPFIPGSVNVPASLRAYIEREDWSK